MADNEFTIIRKYFYQSKPYAEDVLCGIGDDCALLKPDLHHGALALTVDTLIAGVHFPYETSPEDVAYKSLAVSLSDLAAMAAKPAWFTLALTLPGDWQGIVRRRWLQHFSSSLLALAREHHIDLVGGDTTRAEQLSITIQAHGYVDESVFYRRTAKVGDYIIVNDTLGAAALGLELLLQRYDSSMLAPADVDNAIMSLNRPQPALAEAQRLKHYCCCAIDISDGFLADLGHILEQSGCGAHIFVDQIPMPVYFDKLKPFHALKLALTGGDDYRLCACISPSQWQDFCHHFPQHTFSIVGEITAGDNIVFQTDNAELQHYCQQYLHSENNRGYNHFAQ